MLSNTLIIIHTPVESGTMEDDQGSIVFRLRWGTTVGEKHFSTMVINCCTGHIRMLQDKVVFTSKFEGLQSRNL
jgi:hypothetical protein